jgi:hypothetical protein
VYRRRTTDRAVDADVHHPPVGGKLMPSLADDQARRAYWTARMDEADAFMRAIMTYQTQE